MAGRAASGLVLGLCLLAACSSGGGGLPDLPRNGGNHGGNNRGPGGPGGAGGAGGAGGGGARASLLGRYVIEITGRGDFSGRAGRSFRQQGQLLLDPTVTGSRPASNGVNQVEVSIFTARSPVLGNTGGLYFTTNTSLSSRVGSNLGGSRIDVARVAVDRTRNLVDVVVDGDRFGQPTARLHTFNIYNLTGGVTAQVHRVLNGRVRLQVSADGRSVSGTIQLGGSSGFTGAATTSGYLARFTGRRA